MTTKERLTRAAVFLIALLALLGFLAFVLSGLKYDEAPLTFDVPLEIAIGVLTGIGGAITLLIRIAWLGTDGQTPPPPAQPSEKIEP